MHRTIGIVFKILILSLLLMLLLDTASILVQIVTIHTRIENIAGLIQTEVARNNCLPSDTAEAFMDYIVDVAGQTRIMNSQFGVVDGDIQTNFTSSFTGHDGTIYEGLNPGNAKNYGEIATVAIEITVHPIYVVLGRTANNVSWTTLPVRMDYIYKVPCLRYLK